MSLRTVLAKTLVLAILHLGALAGVPMDPQKIRELMEVMHRTKVEHVVKKSED
jgi:hypothetical protein